MLKYVLTVENEDGDELYTSVANNADAIAMRAAQIERYEENINLHFIESEDDDYEYRAELQAESAMGK